MLYFKKYSDIITCLALYKCCVSVIRGVVCLVTYANATTDCNHVVKIVYHFDLNHFTVNIVLFSILSFLSLIMWFLLY